ncbi:hypothetical protein OQA88_1131 [Cercophora sp. LCS_1]
MAQRGFHLLDRHASWFHKTPADWCPKKTQCADIKEPFDYDSVWLLPANNFNCDTLRDKNYDEGIRFTWDIGHGTVLKGQCGAHSLTFFPVSGGNELEVWEDGRMYGKCYRQEPGKTLNCDSPGDGYGCSHPLSGQPVPNSCKIRATDVWGPDGSEVLYESLRDLPLGALNRRAEEPGVAKVLRVCDLAREDGFNYVWIDTCCIDKSSSAELSEAINSMVEWYNKSAVCYAHLADVGKGEGWGMFAESRWFRRGWTLQELIAPPTVLFYDRSWQPLGSRSGLANQITFITKINMDILQRGQVEEIKLEGGGRVSVIQVMLGTINVATRMSWAACRQTTRDEDAAYCLLGIFGVHMPLLYGEGGENAFLRLQREIVQRLPYDQSILAWNSPSPLRRPTAIFSPSPRDFDGNVSIFPQPRRSMDVTVTGNCLQLEVLLGMFINPNLRTHTDQTAEYQSQSDRPMYAAVLSFSRSDGFLAQPALVVQERYTHGMQVYVKMVDGFIWLRRSEHSKTPLIEIPKGNGFKLTEGVKLVDYTEFRRDSITISDGRGFHFGLGLNLRPPVRLDIHHEAFACAHDRHWSFTSSIEGLSELSFQRSHHTHKIPVRDASFARGKVDWIYFCRMDEPTSGFAVLWSFHPDRHGGNVSWWDDAELLCCVLPWGEFTPLLDISDNRMPRRRNYVHTPSLFQFEFLDTLCCGEADYNLLHSQHREDMQRECTRTLEDEVITVCATPIDFLDKRSFQITVRISPRAGDPMLLAEV